MLAQRIAETPIRFSMAHNKAVVTGIDGRDCATALHRCSAPPLREFFGVSAALRYRWERCPPLN